MLMDFSTSFIR